MFALGEREPRQGALGGTGAVPTLSCHAWHSQLVPGLRTRGSGPLLSDPVAFPCRITSSSWKLWSKTLCRSS